MGNCSSFEHYATDLVIFMQFSNNTSSPDDFTPLPVGLLSEFQKAAHGSPYSITERRVMELIPVLGSQPAGDVSHKPGWRLPLLSARPAVTPATLKRAATFG